MSGYGEQVAHFNATMRGYKGEIATLRSRLERAERANESLIESHRTKIGQLLDRLERAEADLRGLLRFWNEVAATRLAEAAMDMRQFDHPDLQAIGIDLKAIHDRFEDTFRALASTGEGTDG